MWKSLAKAFIWTATFIFIGLLQMIINFFISKITASNDFNFAASFYDGFFVFLSLSSACSIAYEFYIDAEVTKSSFWSRYGRYLNLLLVFFVMIVVLVSMIIYSVLSLSKITTSTQKAFLMDVEVAVVISSFVYCFALKWLIYYYDTVRRLIS